MEYRKRSWGMQQGDKEYLKNDKDVAILVGGFGK